MAGGKEIRPSRKHQKYAEVARAMEMVATSKMREAQDRMKSGGPTARKSATWRLT